MKIGKAVVLKISKTVVFLMLSGCCIWAINLTITGDDEQDTASYTESVDFFMPESAEFKEDYTPPDRPIAEYPMEDYLAFLSNHTGQNYMTAKRPDG